ncbi:RHS repeat domain-containing protein [Chitinophaga sp. RCC_12]|uniref:RHS repeat domain-containing protein n=1 Tax=Chitinophaga sp. RCC_12 TaxID=3239226 RepID=UPI003524D6C8
MKGICLLLFSLFFRVALFAQNGPGMMDIPKVIQPSPNAASLGKYGDVPVGLYTGIPGISVPLYTAYIGKVPLPISLSYYASGLKVSELASQVGLGWTLNAGGAVTRSVNVRPDELGYMTQGKLAVLDSIVLTGDRIREAAMGILDLQPDNFSFNFNGRSGKFIIDATPDNKAHIIPFQPLQITYPKRLDSIQIVDENGIIYQFSASETSYTEGAVLFNPFKSAWYLSRIITPYGNATFTYADDVDDVIGEQRTEIDYKRIVGTCDVMTASNSYTQVRAASKVLKSITTPSCIINFYSTANRRDAQSRSKLDSITVLDKKSKRIKNFVFKYSYFGSDTQTDLKYRRLKLDSISEEGVNSIGRKWHSFEYNSPQSVPPTDSKSQDTWGFYNGANNFTLLPQVDTFVNNIHISLSGANRRPDPTFTQIGMLKKIVYPTGGNTEFVYEGNDYGLKNGSQVSYREKIKNNRGVVAFSPTSGTSNVDVETDMALKTGQEVIVSYGAEFDGPASREDNPSMYLYKVGPNNVRTTLLEFHNMRNVHYSQSLYLDSGLYYLRATVDSRSGQRASIGAEYYTYSDSVIIIKAMATGGLRIKEIVNSDGLTNIPVRRKFTYKTTYDPNRSSGNLISDFDFTESKLTNRDNISLGGACVFFIRSSFPVASLTTTRGSNVGYSAVTEIVGDGKTGKKISEFSFSATNMHLPEYHAGITMNYYNIGASEKYTSDMDYLRGSLLRETSYDSSGRKLARTDFSYNTGNLQNGNYFVAKILYGYNLPYCNSQACASCCVSEPMNQGYRLVPSQIVCPWIYEVQRTDSLFDLDNNRSIVKVVNSYYDNAAHAQLSRQSEINSLNQVQTTFFKYPLDYSITGTPATSEVLGIKYLQNNHYISSLVEKYTTIGAATTSASITTYKPDKPYPDAIWGLEYSDPVTNYSPVSVTAASMVKDSRIKPWITFNSYDNFGNIRQQGKFNDASEVYLWGYDNQYPVAKIVGSDYATVAPIVNATILNSPLTDQQLRDELNKLRAALPNALVTTYTYIPLLGVTSETDNRGLTSYYEYDAQGRLKTIKDQDGKIVKLIEYQYRAPFAQ